MNRFRDTRASGTRDATRGAGVFDSIRDIPPGLIPDGLEALWVNEEVLGARQKTNLMVRMNRDGYRPMTMDQVPAFQLHTLDEDKPADNLVRWGGQILMARPKERGDEDRQDQVEAAKAAEREATRGNVTEGLDQRLARDLDAREKTIVRREAARPQFKE